MAKGLPISLDGLLEVCLCSGTNLGANLMVVQQQVRIVDADDKGSGGKELESDMYSLGGWSGGPLCGQYLGG